jgi:hypothetical protein
MKFLIVQLPPFSRHLIPPRSKYSSQNPILKHPQTMIMILKLVIILEEAIIVVETISVTLQVMLQKIQSMVVIIINDRQMGMMVVNINMHLHTGTKVFLLY